MDNGGAFKKVESNNNGMAKFRKIQPHRSRAASDVAIRIERKTNGTDTGEKNGYLAVRFSASIINKMHWPSKTSMEVFEGFDEYTGIIAFKQTKFAGEFYLRQYKRGGQAIVRIPLDMISFKPKHDKLPTMSVDYQIKGDMLQIIVPEEV